jgi:hypothetical protein
MPHLWHLKKDYDSMQQADQEAVKKFLYQAITRQAPERAVAWLDKTLAQFSQAGTEKQFFLAFSSAPRFTGKESLQLTGNDLQEADQLRKGWQPRGWTVDQATRVLLALGLPHQSEDEFVRILNLVFSAAEVGELTALYLSLPVLPYPERHRERAAEGVRSNITAAFEAVALRNPYPAGYLSQEAWNQLVMKAIFVGAPIGEIYGLEERANERLAQTLSDFAHERWAAGRAVPPELWRLVGPFIEEQTLPDLKRLFGADDPVQHRAAALACFKSSFPAAQELLRQRPDLQQQIEAGALTWETVG